LELLEEMTAMNETTPVRDNRDDHRFVYVEDDIEAQLIYLEEDGELVLVHAEVPDALRGRGIGGRLVRAAAERASITGETVVPLCPFTRKWLQAHSEATAGIRVDWSDLFGSATSVARR
jgi:predicted GNAT family acetyltransferase